MSAIEVKAMVPLDSATKPATAVANPSDLTAGSMSYWTSMDPSASGSKTLVYKILQDSEFSVEEKIGETLMLKDVLAHSVMLADKDGREVKERTRIVLIDGDGKTYSCVSEGMRNTLQRLFSIIGKPTYDPPIPVTVRQVGTKRGNRTYTLDVPEWVLEGHKQPPVKKK